MRRFLPRLKAELKWPTPAGIEEFEFSIMVRMNNLFRLRKSRCDWDGFNAGIWYSLEKRCRNHWIELKPTVLAVPGSVNHPQV